MFDNHPTIDIARVKDETDLIALIGADTDLRPLASGRPQGEHHGPCSFCGGTDRMVVWPSPRADGTPPMWMCRQCSPEPSSAIDYVMRREGVGFKEALTILAGPMNLAPMDRPAPPRPVATIEDELERAERLAEYWTRQAAGLRAELGAHPEVAIALERDGIAPQAVTHFGLGYGVHLGARSLVIPWRFSHGGSEVVRGVQYRAILGDAFPDGDPRYRWRAGSQGKSLFNADVVLVPVDDRLVIVEGAKKAMALWSQGAESVVALAGATCWDPTWAPRLAGFKTVVFALDPDATDRAIAAARTVPGARVARLPAKPDDMLKETGGDIDAVMAFIDAARRVD